MHVHHWDGALGAPPLFKGFHVQHGNHMKHVYHKMEREELHSAVFKTGSDSGVCRRALEAPVCPRIVLSSVSGKWRGPQL